MNFKCLLSFLFCTTLFLNSCKIESKKTLKINAEFKNYFKFNERSEWVFKDSSTNLAACTLVLNEFKEGKLQFDNAASQEFFEYKLTGTNIPSFLLRAVADEQNLSRLAIFNENAGIFSVISEIAYSEGLFIPFAGYAQTILQYPSKVIGDSTYTNVAEINILGDAKFSKIILAKGIGIVSIKEKAGRTLYLKSFTHL